MPEIITLPGDRSGTFRTLTVWRFGDQRTGAPVPGSGVPRHPKAFIQAGLHADEIPGMLVAHHLIGRLAGLPVPGEVVVVPMANPVGLAQTVAGTAVGRHALDGSGNFNRGFPDLGPAALERLDGRLTADATTNIALARAALAAAHGAMAPTALTPASEVDVLRHRLLGLALDADIVLDLHCDTESVAHLYTGERLWPEAADIAGELGCRAVLLSGASGGSPFDEACSSPWWSLADALASQGPLPPACLAATVELRGKADVSDALAAADADAIVRILQRRGVVGGAPGSPPPPACPATPLAGLDRLVAPHSGVVVFRKAVGEAVTAGEPVADIVAPHAHGPGARTPLVSRTDGLLMARSDRRFAGQGELVATVAGAVPLPPLAGHGLLFD